MIGGGMMAVDYSPRFRGVCPKCGKTHVPHYCGKPWIRLVKVRYHCCPACGCLFKSTQEDISDVARGILAGATDCTSTHMEAI